MNALKGDTAITWAFHRRNHTYGGNVRSERLSNPHRGTLGELSAVAGRYGISRLAYDDDAPVLVSTEEISIKGRTLVAMEILCIDDRAPSYQDIASLADALRLDTPASVRDDPDRQIADLTAREDDEHCVEPAF